MYSQGSRKPSADLKYLKTYVDEDEPWPDILAISAFTIFSTANGLKYHIMFQLVFVRGIIISIKHTMD